MVDTNTDPVSAEAHERVKRENEKLKADLAAEQERLKTTELGLQLLQMRDDAIKFFRSKGDVPDPLAIASMAVDSAAVRGADDLPAALEAWYDSNKTVFAVATPGEPQQEEPVPPQPSPGFAGPNPAAGGEQASLSPITRAEVIAKHGGMMTPAAAAEMKDAMESGRYQPSYEPPPEFTNQ